MLAFLLVAGLMGGIGGAGASTSSELQAAEARLDELASEISGQQQQLDALEAEGSVLSAHVSDAQAAWEQTQQEVMGVRERLDAARDRYEALRSQLDQRAANAYMDGPASGLEVVLGASSIGEFTDRLEFLDDVAQRDSDLAVRVDALATKLQRRVSVLNRVLSEQAQKLGTLQAQQAELDAKLEQAKAISDDLTSKRAELSSLVDTLKTKLKKERLAAALAAQSSGGGGIFNIADNPLHTCPVDDPHFFSDSFGAPRYAGGYHPHAGTDIMAPRGTPIRATFDGVAESDPNGLGGNAVIVHGAQGYTYNAHLDSYGQLGRVTTGTIIGYVGDSGDAQGGPTHDHFEWHPDVLPSPLYESTYGYTEISGAVDAYPYLEQVC